MMEIRKIEKERKKIEGLEEGMVQGGIGVMVYELN